MVPGSHMTARQNWLLSSSPGPLIHHLIFCPPLVKMVEKRQNRPWDVRFHWLRSRHPGIPPETLCNSAGACGRACCSTDRGQHRQDLLGGIWCTDSTSERAPSGLLVQPKNRPRQHGESALNGSLTIHDHWPSSTQKSWPALMNMDQLLMVGVD